MRDGQDEGGQEKTKEADTDHTASQSSSSGRNEERSKSEGGGRQRLKHVDGDVPGCMKRKPMKEEGIISSCKSDKQAGSTELKDITFIVLQKCMRSMNTSERIDEMLNEAENYKWDAMLVAET